ncbi:MAG: molybdenum cofactor biosynthesis protein MoaE [Planctomycetota bacterium]
MIHLTSEEIDFHQVTEFVRHRSAGAVVSFLGTVREFTRGEQTKFLEYEAYEQMATLSMHELELEVRRLYPVIEVAMVHRIGRMELGDVSVAIAVSAPHRVQAFDAAKWLIDTLKERVPIWKKEHYADGREEWQHPVAPDRDTSP